MPSRTTRGRAPLSQRGVIGRAERTVTVARPLPLNRSTTRPSGVARRWLPTMMQASLTVPQASPATPERASAGRRNAAAGSHGPERRAPDGGGPTLRAAPAGMRLCSSRRSTVRWSVRNTEAEAGSGRMARAVR
jgi:hypothetical protein